MTIPATKASGNTPLASALSLLHEVRSALQLLQNELMILIAHAPLGEGQLAQGRCRWLGEVVTCIEEIVELISAGGPSELEQFLTIHLRSALELGCGSIARSVINNKDSLRLCFSGTVSGSDAACTAHSCVDLVRNLRLASSVSSKIIDILVALLKGEGIYTVTAEMRFDIVYTIPTLPLYDG